MNRLIHALNGNIVLGLLELHGVWVITGGYDPVRGESRSAQVTVCDHGEGLPVATAGVIDGSMQLKVLEVHTNRDQDVGIIWYVVNRQKDRWSSPRPILADERGQVTLILDMKRSDARSLV